MMLRALIVMSVLAAGFLAFGVASESHAEASPPSPRRNPHRAAAVAVAVEPMPARDPAEDCPVRAVLVERLKDRFGEVLVARYVDSNGVPFELYGSPRGTLTVVFVPPRIVRGTIRACVASTGDSLRIMVVDT
jgi:hypothetical protein